MLSNQGRERIEEFRNQVGNVIDADAGEIDVLLVAAAVQGRMQRDDPTRVRAWLLGIVQALSTGELDLSSGGKQAADQPDQGAA